MRIFLLFQTLLWLPYGVFCFFNPEFLDGAAEIRAHGATGLTELRAMYGGLQAGIGLFCGLSLLRENLQPSALRMLVFLTGGLGFARLLAAFISQNFSGYTIGALLFEFASFAVGCWLLGRLRNA